MLAIAQDPRLRKSCRGSLFNAKFGENDAKFGENENIYSYKYCLENGVTTSFDRDRYKQLADSAILSYDTRREPSDNRNQN